MAARRLRWLPIFYGLGLLVVGCALVDRLVQRAASGDPTLTLGASLGLSRVTAARVQPLQGSLPAPRQEPEVPASEPALRPSDGDEADAQRLEEIAEDSDDSNAEDRMHRIDPDRSLLATAKYTKIYKAPDFGARKLGYLRAGAIVRRSPSPEGTKRCPGGWYGVEPMGYVCVGSEASLSIDAPLSAATARRADRSAALPYSYGISRNPPPPFYTRVPSQEEQQRIEPDLVHHLRYRSAKDWLEVGLLPVPEFLQGGQPSLRVNGTRQSALVVNDGHAVAKSAFAMLSLFEAQGRAFGVTTDLAVVPLDRLDRVQPSRFHGLPLSTAQSLPVVFVRSKGAYLYEGDPQQGGLKISRALEYREALSISGERKTVQGKAYLETTSGHWLVDQRLLRVDPVQALPSWVQPGRPWIDVSILKQTLVAYEGSTPMFVTLISTGVDGLGDPTTTHSTIQGRFLIHTKHVSVTMDGDEVGDEYDFRDVPYVQYFHQGYALHGAYWHDAFGTPRSHGCVNLSPLDARWLFGWTDPPVPGKWHGAMSLLEGTLISIHP